MGMSWCCPHGHGCNAPGGNEPCALDLCRAAADHERYAAQAVARWTAWQEAHKRHRGDRERRFRRRAYERSRDRALRVIALRPQPARGSGWPRPFTRRRSQERVPVPTALVADGTSAAHPADSRES